MLPQAGPRIGQDGQAEAAKEGVMRGGTGLTEVTTGDLKKALKVVHQGHLAAPLSLPELTRCGLQHCADALMAALRDVDTAGLRAVLVCVLAERRAQEEAAARGP